MKPLVVLPAVLDSDVAADAFLDTIRRLGPVPAVAVLQGIDRLQAMVCRSVGKELHVARFPRPLGKWRAVWEGVRAAELDFDYIVVVDADGAYDPHDGLRLAEATSRSAVSHGIGRRRVRPLVDKNGQPSNERLWTELLLNALLLRKLGRPRDPRLAAYDIQCGLVALAGGRSSDLERAARSFYGGELVLFASTVRLHELPLSLDVECQAQASSTLDVASVIAGALSIEELRGTVSSDIHDAIDDACAIYELDGAARQWLQERMLDPDVLTVAT